MTTTDTQAAIERMRGWLTGVVSRGSNIESDVARLLAAYDARGKEIEALKAHHDACLDKVSSALDICGDERDGLKAKLEAVRGWLMDSPHREACLLGRNISTTRTGLPFERGECTCGLSAALESVKSDGPSEKVATAMERSKPLVKDALKLGRSIAGPGPDDHKLRLK